MVAPTAFTFNEQAAQDNHFMHAINSGGEVQPTATSGMLVPLARTANSPFDCGATLRALLHLALVTRCAPRATSCFVGCLSCWMLALTGWRNSWRRIAMC